MDTPPKPEDTEMQIKGFDSAEVGNLKKSSSNARPLIETTGL
jgi:hypothetical protein